VPSIKNWKIRKLRRRSIRSLIKRTIWKER